MIHYYSTEERRKAFDHECRKWLGTPFRENVAIIGAGVDCSRYALAVHTACAAVPAGVVLDVLPVEWVRGWGEHHAESRVIDFFHQPEVRARLRRVEDDGPKTGDIAVMQFSRACHHVGLYSDMHCYGEIFHVSPGAGVVAHALHLPIIKKSIRAYYRIHEL
jgi:hypothetical protein